MDISISHSPAETAALGEDWGRTVSHGTVIALCGDLGAGKTQLVKGLARGLGITARIQSPTFALVNCYPGGRIPLFHLDLYRLETPQLVLAAGLEEYLHPQGVSVIEWAERWFLKKPTAQCPEAKPVDSALAHVAASRKTALRWVELEVINDTDRRISYEDLGA